MKTLVDKSMGVVTRITEDLARIKPTDPLRLVLIDTTRSDYDDRQEHNGILSCSVRPDVSLTSADVRPQVT
jgi:hypothetical protein